MFLIRRTAILIFCSSIFINPAFGGSEDSPGASSAGDWEPVCKEAAKIPFPPKDRPGPEEAKTLTNCSSRDLYYGFDKPADPVQARKCAYLEMEKGDDLVFGGSSILMMIYANGKGAERNLDLAIKFACRLNMVGAIEDKDRVMHLAKLKREKWKGDNFSLCDDITSGFMEGHCADLEGRFAQAKRGNKLTGLVGGWNEKDKSAFGALEKAFHNFVRLRVNNEVDLSGTGRGAFMIEEESSLREDFVSALEKFEHGEFPPFGPEQFINTDKELNSVYQKIQKTRDPARWGTVTKEGIKNTQRAWLKYRDAWVAFGQQKYPTVGSDSWKTWLTRNRIRMLSEFIENQE